MTTVDELRMGTINEIFPFFRAPDMASLDLIESDPETGDIYYVLADFSFTTRDSKGTEVKNALPTIFRIKKNMIGRSVAIAGAAELDAKCDLKPNGFYSLPLIPYEMVAKMDAFFRKVDQLHHSESIVVLTYDKKFLECATPEEQRKGWGVIVPQQSNTGVHCKYEHASVMKEKPAGVYIVGTAHSHPGMDAYASPTDHDDQKDIEGVHITFGWKPHGNLVTEYYAEVNIGGKFYPFSIDQVFEAAPKPIVNTDEVEDWVGKVQKQAFNTNTSHNVGTGIVNHNTSTADNFLPAGKKSRATKFPSNCPLPSNNTIIATLYSGEKKCPACSVPLQPHIIDGRRCIICHTFLALEGETLEQILAQRVIADRPYAIELDPTAAPRPIILWTMVGNEDVFSEDLRIGSNPKV